MSKKSIKIDFEWSKEKAIEASKKFYDYDMRNSKKRYVGWLFVALTQFAIVGALKHDSYGLLYLSTFLVAYWYYGRWYLRKAMLEKFYEKQNFKDGVGHFVFDSAGLHSDEQVIGFDDIFSVVVLVDGVLVLLQNNTLFFSRDAFASYEDYSYFLDQMKQQGKV